MGLFGKSKAGAEPEESLTEEDVLAVEEGVELLENALAEHREEEGDGEDDDADGEEPVDEQEEELKIIIKDAAIMVAVATLASSAVSAIPGLGAFAGVIFGAAVSSSMISKIQGEMVRDIGRLYGEELTPTNQQRAMITIMGVQRGVAQGVNEIGTRIATQTTSKAVSYIPFVGPLSVASVNMTVTYVVGYRTRAYFKLGPDRMGSWQESVRAVSGIDELKMSKWMGEALTIIKKRVKKTAGNTPGKVANKIRNSIRAISNFKAGRNKDRDPTDENDEDGNDAAEI